MKKKAKALLIPIAAFAVTITGVSAFNEDVLIKAGLNDVQISAFEDAQELRKSGDKEGARDVLVEAGIDVDAMHAVGEAMHEYRKENRDAVHTAVENNDYAAFTTAVAGSPIADIVTSEDDFAQFVEAAKLREAGDMDAAHTIMQELGFTGKMGAHKGGHHMLKGDHDEVKFTGKGEGRFNGFNGGHTTE